MEKYKNKSIVLLDGNALMYRSYYSVQFKPEHNGIPVGMVFGFFSYLASLCDLLEPTRVIVAFDMKAPTFRHKKDPEYKAQRSKAPDDFYPQQPYVFQVLDALGIERYGIEGYEADDIIGTLATEVEQKSDQIAVIASGDMDFVQLVSDQVHLLRFKGSLKDPQIVTPENAQEIMGVDPSLVVDLKGLCGDSADNYKGLPGLGPKGAIKLLDEYGSLQSVLDNVDQLTPKLQEKFNEHRDYVLHCQEIAEILTTVDVDGFSFDKFEKISWKKGAISLRDIGFGGLSGRYFGMSKKFDQNKSIEQENKAEQPSLF